MPPMTSTPNVIASVPSTAFSRPPVFPLVWVVSTLKLKCGTARSMMPPASQIVGHDHQRQSDEAQHPEDPVARPCAGSGTSGQLNSPVWLPGTWPADAELLMLASQSPADRQRGP